LHAKKEKEPNAIVCLVKKDLPFLEMAYTENNERSVPEKKIKYPKP